MLHRYLVTRTGTNTYIPHGDGKALDVYRPKYIGDLEGIKFQSEYYGAAPVFMVTADLSDFDHDLVSSQPDVFTFPDNEKELIDPAKMKAFFAANKIPEAHLDETWTHEEAIQSIQKIFAVTQILNGLHAAQKREFMSLDTKFEDFAPVVKYLTTLNPTVGVSVFDMLSGVSDQLKKPDANIASGLGIK